MSTTYYFVNFSSSFFGPNEVRDLKHSLCAGISIGIAVIAVISFVIIYSFKRGHFSSNSMAWWKRDAKNDLFKTQEIIKSYGLMAPKRYTYLNLKKITNSFKEKVGQGGFGVVYKEKLLDGRMVAVKIL
jgi:hypothetical protein